jgi:hypothetical protein
MSFASFLVCERSVECSTLEDGDVPEGLNESVVLRPPLCVSVEHVQSTPGNVDVPAGLNQSYQVKYLHCIAAEVHSYPKEVSILNA